LIYLARDETLGVGLDHVGSYRAGGQRVARRYGGGCGHEAAARKRRDFCQSDDI
jgi:hypothetical protein